MDDRLQQIKYWLSEADDRWQTNDIRWLVQEVERLSNGCCCPKCHGTGEYDDGQWESYGEGNVWYSFTVTCECEAGKLRDELQQVVQRLREECTIANDGTGNE